MRKKLSFWAAVSRAPFFTGSALPVGLGAAAVWYQSGEFRLGLFVLTLVGAVLVHAGANIANDYYDHLSGADDINPDFHTPLFGGSRLIQDGLMTPRATLMAALACLSIAAVIGIVLTWLRGWPILALGLVGVLSGFFYTAPPLKLSYRGWGELAVALDFGVLMVAGTQYVQVRAVTAVGLAASVPVALLILLVLYVNQFPDAPADGQAGKRHLVVRWGTRRARLGVPVLYAATYASILAAIAAGLAPGWCLVALLTAPLGAGASAVVWQYHSQPKRLVPASAMTIAAHALTSVLLIIGYVAGRASAGV
ncbi:MAG: 1,4-dihydroxy-2-naphthoate octaprenyltransferase [Armatimonadota bacterium]|nr:MAG: 1,4-dihydroxy-2-naphthoate octaprenyltransferase [Armatimonadota bacterium]